MRRSAVWLLVAGMLAASAAGCARTKISLQCQTMSTEQGWAPVTTDHLSVRTGQQLKYVIQTDPGVYLYMLHAGASGECSVLAPTAVGPNAQNFLQAGLPYSVPSTGWIRVAPPAGTERLVLVAAKHRIPEIDALISQGGFSPQEMDRVLQILASRRSSGYKLDKTLGPNLVKFEVSSEEPDPELVGEITLDHTPGPGETAAAERTQRSMPPKKSISVETTAPPQPSHRPRVRFWVERTRAGSRDLEYVTDATDADYYTGDHVVFKFNANVTCYAYLVMRGSSGKVELLYPGLAGRDNHVPAGETRTMPSARGSFAFDKKPGTERLYLLVSPRPIEGLQEAASRGGGRAVELSGGLEREWNDSVGKSAEMGRSRDLVLEENEASGGEPPNDSATYQGSSFDKPITVHMNLRHEP
ncbi:MAG: DUF4384 domain-containing protein [Candidatus Sumerlaeota bacterium]|nr:DUF4384 domain-containing protein [Candidatus Sumerlaeota bacterium]